MFIENSLFKISPPTKEDLISIRDLYTNLLVMKFIPNSSQIWNIQSVEAKIKKFQNDTIGIHVVKTQEKPQFLVLHKQMYMKLDLYFIIVFGEKVLEQ